MTPSAAISGPAELVAAVPHLLGFHPSDSIVAVGFGEDRVEFAARIDAPPPGPPPTEIVSAFAATVSRQRSDYVVLVGYGPPERVEPTLLALEDVPHLPVRDVLRVTDGRFQSCWCDDPECCPPEGHPVEAAAFPDAGGMPRSDRDRLTAAFRGVSGRVPRSDRDGLAAAFGGGSGRVPRLDRGGLAAALRGDSGRVPRLDRDGLAAAFRGDSGRVPLPDCDGLEAVFRGVSGRVPLPDREALAATIAPVRGAARAAMRRATVRARDRLARLDDAAVPSAAVLAAGDAALRTALRRHRAGRALSDNSVAWLSVLVGHPEVQDRALAAVSDPEPHSTLWAEVVRRAEPELVADPAGLLAFAAWRAGNGALASIAVERALTVDPTNPLAMLMDDVLTTAIPPSTLDGSRARRGARRGRRQRPVRT